MMPKSWNMESRKHHKDAKATASNQGQQNQQQFNQPTNQPIHQPLLLGTDGLVCESVE
jgi:hypothetical protein